MKYNSCVILMVLCYSCGPPERIEVPPDAVPIDAGRYNAKLDKIEPSTCNILPKHAEENWLIHLSDNEIYSFEVQGIAMESDDGIEFFGEQHIESIICGTGIYVSAYLTKTDYGFSGEAMLTVDSGICGRCIDYAVLEGDKIL